MLSTMLLTTDLLLTGFTVGTTLWFFFVQSPFLFNLMGREKFVPIMMQLTKLWVTTMFASVSGLMAVVTVLLRGTTTTTTGGNMDFYLVGLAWLAIVINKFLVVPQALKAGARSHAERKGDNSKDVKSFVVRGGSRTETKKWHQTVVLFVLVMAGALVAHTVSVAAAIVG
mmetsp:Transcript_41821/g.100373  ORF Transcript_41821/g.100373 Transcript_41821/m.100373 type:complete len:170 (-) Transcript_41821:56-565(-)